MQIRLAVFGAFRGALAQGELEFSLPDDARVQHLRQALKAHLRRLHPEGGDDALVDRSAFADVFEVLDEETPLAGRQGLAVLPPVCGG
ncbi:hypothetical protein GALL_158770 [mine drainage metagenome]|uniref:Molybdopterin synthase sulfur carrier subunit n=1 Tax=mine drainage metagenome TaxID=410659 RepID=A0A1J5S1Y3_9ZZZZ